MKDRIEALVAAAKTKALAERDAQAARDAAAREQRVEQDRVVAELLLARVRPLLGQIAASLNRQIEGEWHVEWFEPANGNAGLRLESAQHPGFFAVDVARDLQATLTHRTLPQDERQCALGGALEDELLAGCGVWVDALLQSPHVRLRA